MSGALYGPVGLEAVTSNFSSASKESRNNRTVAEHIEAGTYCVSANTPVFAASFVEAVITAIVGAASVTYVGTATGKRYNAALNGVITTNNGGANFFPGSVAGTTATGGHYA